MTRRNMAEQMFNDVVNTIRESQSDLEKTISQFTSGSPSGGPAGPLTDIIEDNDNITVKIDLPGALKDDIKVDIGEDAVEITVQYEEEVFGEGARYVKRERKNDVINRIIELPAKIKIEEATASHENGVLTITLPKLEKKETFGVKVD